MAPKSQNDMWEDDLNTSVLGNTVSEDEEVSEEVEDEEEDEEEGEGEE